jgi:hypothetical protein
MGTPEGDLAKVAEHLRFGGLEAQAALEAGRAAISSAPGMLGDAVSGVKRLETWAGQAAQRNRSEYEELSERNATEAAESGRQRLSRNKGDKALSVWIDTLAWIWFDIFEKKPGRSFNSSTGDVGGPFVRFVRACMQPALDLDTPTEAAIAEKVKVSRLRAYLRGMGKSKAGSA